LPDINVKSGAYSLDRSSPISFPAPPPYYSPSSLQAVEQCAKRWALTWAKYDPPISEQDEYPSPDSASAIGGLVVHKTIERLIKELSNAGCVSVHSAKAVDVISSIGGISIVIDEISGHILDRISSNPRNVRRIDVLIREVTKNRLELRRSVQLLLRRVDELEPKNSRSDEKRGVPGQRPPLNNGVFTEVYLKSEFDSLHGSADKISITNGKVAISDFKTGQRSESHLDQVRMYGLMYFGDSERNPHGKFASRLELDYPNEQAAEVRESIDFWVEFRKKISMRISSANQAIQSSPVPATRTSENCSFCPVRHHCNEFMNEMSLTPPDHQSTDRLVDLRIQIQSITNSRSAEAVIINSTKPEITGDCILVDTVADIEGLSPGDELVVLNVSVENSDQLKSVCSMGPYAEYFVIDQSSNLS
jgi:CRISPR/Cas system-associated exonuclease Cas4 (RecB family)